MWHKIGYLFDVGVRLVPAVALFSLLFVMEGNLKWLGLLGVIPLFMAAHPGCPTCDPRANSCDANARPWKTWPGH